MSSFQLHFFVYLLCSCTTCKILAIYHTCTKKYKLAKMSFLKIHDFLLYTQRTIVYAFARVQKCLVHTSLRVHAIGPVI